MTHAPFVFLGELCGISSRTLRLKAFDFVLDEMHLTIS
jgi:hypothetical protein